MKVDFQQEKIKQHALTTEEIYKDIYNVLEEKFKVEQKAKLTEITSRLKTSFEEQVTQMNLKFQKSEAAIRKKQAVIEL